ncbi:MAG: GAF domain-containing protein [Nitrospirae bacterium]|nr:GAF domain-containing protein [Nitrospirota bacterium]
MPKLIISHGSAIGYDFNITDRLVTIGRAKDNDIILEDHKASRYHAEIKNQDGKFIIFDKGSKNGIKVNGVLVKSKPLNFNDKIVIGGFSIVFVKETIDNVNFTSGDVFLNPKENVIKRSIEDISNKTLMFQEADFSDLKSVDIKKNIQQKQKSPTDKDQQMLLIMYQISKDLISVVELNDLMDKLMNYVFKITKADRGFLMLIDEGTNELIPLIARHRRLDGDITITISMTMAREVIEKKVSILTNDALSDDRFSSQESIILNSVHSAMCVPLWSKKGVIGILYVDYMHTLEQFTQDDLELMTAFANLAAIGIEHTNLIKNIREEQIKRNSLTRFFSPNVVEEIMKNASSSIKDEDSTLGIIKTEATIFFSDIKGFTTLSERLEPQEVAHLLTEYFTVMTEVIFKYGGTLDKFIGDAIMAIYGVPKVLPNSAFNAVSAAIEMLERLQEINSTRDEHTRFDIRIGINTGQVVAGTMGSKHRLEYSVIGDTVNIASRLESLAPKNGILIGEHCYKMVRDQFEIKSLGTQKIKGKTNMINIYEVIGKKI